MRVINRKKIRNATEEHPEWEASLLTGYKVPIGLASLMRNKAGRTRTTSPCVVFDISHNKCRLVAWINYRSKKVFIRHVLSHADYDKEKWKDDCDCD